MKCEICGKDVSKYWKRCEEHHICDMCGTKENLHYRNNQLTCNACRVKIVNIQVETFGGNTEHTLEITCPWCGYTKACSWVAPDEAENICRNCGNKYKHARCYSTTYSTEKIDKEE